VGSRVDRQLGRASGCLPAGGHEQRVVEQWVEPAAAEQGGGHAGEVGIQRRDVRVSMPRRWGVLRGEEGEIRRVDDDAPVSPTTSTRGHRDVVDAVGQVRRAHRFDLPAVAEHEQREGGEVCARGLTSNDQSPGAQLALCIRGEPADRAWPDAFAGATNLPIGAMSPLAGDGDVPEHATTEPGPDKVNKHRFRRGPRQVLRACYAARTRGAGTAIRGMPFRAWLRVWRGRRSGGSA
jgi:hypothetical protein